MTATQPEQTYLTAAEVRTPSSALPLLKRLRIRQIQFCSRWLRTLSSVPMASAVIKEARELPVFREILRAMTGYNRPFATLQEANAFIAGYDGGGHSHPFCATNIMLTVEKATPSDYAALFVLQPLLPSIRTVFDFGGSVGNLLYCYSNYLCVPSDLTWTVYDVAENVRLGERIAAETGEGRLRFTGSLSEGEGVDMFIATGALHYFEKPLHAIIAEFKHKPRHVLINRTPLTDGHPFATVQDAGRYRVACILHNQEELIRGFEAAGYELMDSWRAAERSLIIPCYPDRSVNAYSGMFFRLRQQEGTSDEERTKQCW